MLQDRVVGDGGLKPDLNLVAHLCAIYKLPTCHIAARCKLVDRLHMACNTARNQKRIIHFFTGMILVTAEVQRTVLTLKC